MTSATLQDLLDESSQYDTQKADYAAQASEVRMSNDGRLNVTIGGSLFGGGCRCQRHLDGLLIPATLLPAWEVGLRASGG